jgi:hypothetical protein
MMFSEPFESSDGTVVITVRRPGWRDRPPRPMGVFTVTAERATWTPAIDTSRLAMVGVCTGFAAVVISTAAILRRPPWPEMTERVMIAMSKDRAQRRG